MDWNKTKSIFIAVFLVLNVFLYSQYLNIYKEAQKLEVLGETTKIEARLKEDNITYITLPMNIETASYLSGKMKHFQSTELPYFTNQDAVIEDETMLHVTMEKPVKLRDLKDKDSFKEFVQMYVSEGDSYVLWEYDEESREAIFFQRMNDRTLYYNVGGIVKIYWNAAGEVFSYEQTMLEKLEDLEQQETILPPIQIIQVLYGRNLLKADSQITVMKLGYSTLVQLTQTQVFAPTWEVRVKTADGTEEYFFVNAVEGKIIDIEQNFIGIDDVEE